jgi:hypothetical protein
MSSFSQGKFALAISDRSGMAFPYNEMVTEWNGAFVHMSEYEPKQPQLQPKPTNADPQALQKARPARTEFATEDFLPDNPITTTAANTTLKIDFPNGDLQIDDFIRLRNVKSPVGGVPIVTGASGPALELSTTLDTAVTLTDTTVTVQTGTHFPTTGFLMIEKVNAVSGLFENEVIQYTGRAGENFTGCTRGTSAPYRGVSPTPTTANTHPIGAKVFGAYKVDSLNTTQVLGMGQPLYTTRFDGINVTLVSNATSTETGGGFQCTIGPLNDRA